MLFTLTLSGRETHGMTGFCGLVVVLWFVVDVVDGVSDDDTGGRREQLGGMQSSS